MNEESVILDVTPGGDQFDTKFLEGLGHPVLVCRGPEEGHLCPILKGSCEMVSGAHGIVFQLDLDRPQHRAILKRYQQTVDEDVPIWACVPEGQDRTYAELLSGVTVVIGQPSAGALDAFAAQVEAADRTR
jgi:hypothetical protein